MLEAPTPNLWEGSLSRIVDFGHAVGQELEMKALGAEHELMHGEAPTVRGSPPPSSCSSASSA